MLHINIVFLYYAYKRSSIKELNNMKSSKMPYILCSLMFVVMYCSGMVIATFEPNKLLGYLPLLIAVYCTESSISRTYNLFVNHFFKYDEDKQNELK